MAGIKLLKQPRPSSICVFAINPTTGLTECSKTRTFTNEKDAMRYVRELKRHTDLIVDWQNYWRN